MPQAMEAPTGLHGTELIIIGGKASITLILIIINTHPTDSLRIFVANPNRSIMNEIRIKMLALSIN